ncbi:MAG TPA: hypothetical protein P5524_00745 [Candidatus Paceibacterota bacterium]|nr:hypothetical protein [Candidatus Paceibacterota bacterium]
MSDLLRFLKFRAVEERVSEERLRNLLAETRSGKIDGVRVDLEHRRIIVDCVLKEGELTMVYPVITANFVRISIAQSERGPLIGVLAENGRDIEPFLTKTKNGNFRIFAFRNGVVLRCLQGNGGYTVLADYAAVRYEGSRAFVVCVPRFEVGIPQFAAEGDLEEYLRTIKVPEEYFGIVKRLVGTGGSQARLLNQRWVGGLQGAKEKTEDESAGSKDRLRSDKGRSRKSEGHGPKPAKVPEDKFDVKRGASLADVGGAEAES